MSESRNPGAAFSFPLMVGDTTGDQEVDRTGKEASVEADNAIYDAQPSRLDSIDVYSHVHHTHIHS